MTAVLERPAASDTGSAKRCQCRSYNPAIRKLEKCHHPAAWVYTMKCCGRETFVCEQHRQGHARSPNARYRCTYCRLMVMQFALLVSRVVRL